MKTPHKFLPYSNVETRLAKSRNYWICTARPDGRPHSIPVWGFFLDGALYFGTSRLTRKARNLAHNPALSVHLESGDDVVILEGSAVEVDITDKPTFKKLDTASRSKYRMPLMLVPFASLPKIPCVHRDAFLVDAKPRQRIAPGHWHRNLAGIVAVAALGLIASSCRHRERFVEPADSPQHVGVIDQVFGNDMDGARSGSTNFKLARGTSGACREVRVSCAEPSA